MSARQVMRYTVVVRHPRTDVATAVLAEKPVPSWAKDLVHQDDLVYAQVPEVEDAPETPANSVPALDVPEGDLEELLAWISEGEGPIGRAERGNALYLKAAQEGSSDEDLEELGHLVMGAVYQIATEPEPESGPVPQSGPDAAEPPRAGQGSGLDAWAAYAKGLGIEVPADAKRDDVIELVDQHSASAQG